MLSKLRIFPEQVFDFVEFPTGYIQEGTGVAYREQAGTFTATYTDDRAAGQPRPTAEAVRTDMEFDAVWATDSSTCMAYSVEGDNLLSWPPTGEGEDCAGYHTFNDGMGASISDVGREVFPAAGKERIAGEGSDLRNRVALAIAASLPQSQLAAGTVYSITLTLETTCKEIGCLYCTAPSPFNSIPASFYWAAVTMTTVGYGDVFPVTAAGQFVASLTMMVGILILALPITVIGTYFAAEYEEYLRRQVCTAKPPANLQSSQRCCLELSTDETRAVCSAENRCRFP